MESKLSKFPIKVLVEIALKVMDEDFDTDNPYDTGYEQGCEIIQDASSWASVGTIEALDMEFIAKFIEINDGLLEEWQNGHKRLNDFIIPRPKKYDVRYSSKGRAYVTQNYTTDWTSYDEDWVGDAMREIHSSGDWSYYDGDYVDQDVEDFEEDDLDIDSVEEVSNYRNENIISKLVLENTTEVLDNLDRDTLIKLRNLISQKLSF